MHFQQCIGYVDIAGCSPTMGRQTSTGWWKNTIFEQNASISLARWRWRLLHYFKLACNLFSRRIGAIFGMLSHRAGLSVLAGLFCL